MAAREGAGRAGAGERVLAGLLLVGWLAMPAFVLLVGEGNRIFWTVLVASLPFAWVVFGFHAWRRNCPLAAISQFARWIGRPGQRRVPNGFAQQALLVQLALMVAFLSLRLLGANGTPLVLVGMLLLLSTAALISGFLFGGKTWCNHLCPVSLVEKIYTEPIQLVPSGNSQCATCTACKKHCPDIDAEQGYWKENRETPRRIAYFAWPGVVLGFYAWFWLQAGDWQAYFGGEWTRRAVTAADLAGPGLWFLPQVPWALSAPLTLVAFGGLSFSLFSWGERLALRRGTEPARVRHLALALSGFVAITLFYVFAGQPTLRLAPDWLRQGIVYVAWFSCALLFFRRWTRSERDFVRERFARKILKRWTEGESPDGSDLNEVYFVHAERTRQREARLEAYAETLRELIADGVLTRDKLSALDTMRAQLGVTEAEHERVLKGLEDADRALFDPEAVQSADERLQEAQYRKALEVLVRDASTRGRVVDPERLEDLRASWGVAPERHAAILEALQDPESVLQAVVAEQLAAVVQLGEVAAAARAAGVAGEPEPRVDFILHACRHAALRHVERVLAVHRSLGGRDPEASAVALVQGETEAREALDRIAAQEADSSPLRRLASALSPFQQEVEPSPDESEALVPRMRAAADLAPSLVAVADRIEGLDSPAAERLDSVLALRSVELLRDLEPEALESLSGLATRRRFEEGELLCRQGEAGDEVFVLLSGRVRVWLDEPDAPAIPDCGAGTCIGELAALDPAPRTANVAALEGVDTLVLTGEDFQGMLDRHPDIARGVMKELIRRLRRKA